MVSRWTILHKSRQPGWQPPISKRLKQIVGKLQRTQNLDWWTAAPLGVQLRIQKAEHLLLEALEEYEPHVEQFVAQLREDYAAQTGNVHDPRADKSPYLGKRTLDGIGTGHEGGPPEEYNNTHIGAEERKAARKERELQKQRERERKK